MKELLNTLRIQRWDDHRYYHHSRINQSLHLVSALSFLVSYVLPFINPTITSIKRPTSTKKRSRSATTCIVRLCCSRSGPRSLCWPTCSPHSSLGPCLKLTKIRQCVLLVWLGSFWALQVCYSESLNYVLKTVSKPHLLGLWKFWPIRFMTSCCTVAHPFIWCVVSWLIRCRIFNRIEQSQWRASITLNRFNQRLQFLSDRSLWMRSLPCEKSLNATAALLELS